MVAWLVVAVTMTVACLLFGWLHAVRVGRLAGSPQSTEAPNEQVAATGNKVRRGGGRAGQGQQQRVDVTRKQPSQQQQQRGSHSQQSSLPSHPLLVRHLKGHSDHCTAVAFGLSPVSLLTTAAPATRHLLAVSSRDRLVRVWHVDDEDDSGRTGGVMSGSSSGGSEVVNVKMRSDFATALCFDHGGSLLYCVMSDTHAVDAYDITTSTATSHAQQRSQHPDGKLAVTFSRSFPIVCRDTVSAAHCTPHRLLLLMSRGVDSPVLVYNAASGELLRSVSLNQLRNYDMACSSDGRFFAAATQLSDVKLWRTGVDRSGQVTPIEHTHCMTLTGHSKAVQSVCFPHSDTACTLTADGRLRAFNIAVRYADGEEPRLRWTSDLQLPSEPQAMRCSLAFSPSSPWLLAVSTAREVRVYRADRSCLCELVTTVEVGGQWGVAAVELRSDGKRLVTINAASKTAEYWRVPDSR